MAMVYIRYMLYVTTLCANTYFARISCYFLIWTELLLKNRIKMAFVINVSIKFNDLFALVVHVCWYEWIYELGWIVRGSDTKSFSYKSFFKETPPTFTLWLSYSHLITNHDSICIYLNARKTSKKINVCATNIPQIV